MDQNDTLLAYLQGRLSDEDRIAFESDMSQDADLAAEVAVLQGAKIAMTPQDVPDKSEGWDRISSLIDQDTFQPANLNHPIRLSLFQTAASVVLAVFVWQAVAVPYLTPGSYFSPASESTSAPVLQIVFADDAMISEISALLKSLEGSVISGPGALGIYRVAFSDDGSIQSAKSTLEARSDLIVRVFTE